jgi:hypothetical protein
VGPDRFDDVEYRVLEQPEPPRAPRMRRWTLTALAVVVATGALSGGASALTSDEAAAPAKVSHKSSTSYRDFRDCDRYKRHESRSSAVRY